MTLLQDKVTLINCFVWVMSLPVSCFALTFNCFTDQVILCWTELNECVQTEMFLSLDTPFKS